MNHTPSPSSNNRRPAWLSLALVIAIVLGVIEWRPWHQFNSVSQTVEQTVNAPTTEEKNSVDLELQPIRAQLTPVRYTTVTSELGARVQEIPFREGESFKEGQKLVVFDCATQQAQYSKSKAAMAIAERNYVTNKKLLALGSVGRIEYENSASEYQKAKAEADELVAVVDKCTILAPFNGRVVEQKVRAQQFIQAGQPVLDILDSSALELEFVAPSKWSPWLVEGHQFQVRVDESGKSYPAKITRVGARIDPISQTIKVAAVIDGDYKELSPGMSGTIEIEPPKSP